MLKFFFYAMSRPETPLYSLCPLMAIKKKKKDLIDSEIIKPWFHYKVSPALLLCISYY